MRPFHWLSIYLITRKHSSRMHTTRFSGHLSCIPTPLATHAPLSCMTPLPLPCTPLAMHPPPHMPPCHACPPPAMHHAHPLPHVCTSFAMHTPLTTHAPFTTYSTTVQIWHVVSKIRECIAREPEGLSLIRFIH